MLVRTNATPSLAPPFLEPFVFETLFFLGSSGAGRFFVLSEVASDFDLSAAFFALFLLSFGEESLSFFLDADGFLLSAVFLFLFLLVLTAAFPPPVVSVLEE